MIMRGTVTNKSFAYKLGLSIKFSAKNRTLLTNLRTLILDRKSTSWISLAIL
jgi:hypothetical protein